MEMNNVVLTTVLHMML